ncbi:MAG: PH domain-containing protein [Planctomycetota bacterium]
MSETSRNGNKQSVYRSKVDLWIACLLVASPLGLMGLTVFMMQQGRDNDSLICLIAAAITLFATALFTVPCRYTILSDSLTIRCGILFYRVPFERIKVIEPSGSWLSAPAMSLRRVKISTASQFYLVSPQDRERFIEELTSACGLDEATADSSQT